MTTTQLQAVLAEYTDHYINSQPPSERSALRIERAELEAELASKLAHRGRLAA